ncbi:transposable element Tcb2 transposase [Trichonephila clavipes]|uniref:Transposable element Tcb2 transposase n=1 Tax=Trichonephila clavipes TaxID=2585209 RepID=A0A8X6V0F0_TRICX|nr:transposable element Tcb2 transposase [Trichonephila clavipes]
MVWGAIVYISWSPLALIRSTMTVHRYAQNILQTHVLPLVQQFSGARFQQVNDEPHTARVSQDCSRTVTTLPWSSRSPDLSPIESIWDDFRRLVGHSMSLKN